MAKRRSIVSEFYDLIRQNKAYWLTPIIIVILFFSVIIMLGALGGGAVAPYIYALF